jgi:eukaryotic-like serine/threonine-protein kinase
LQPTTEAAPAVGGVAAQQATGGFSIETSPSGAAVLLNGQSLTGVTPLRVGNLLPRVYDVRVKLAGFKEHQAQVEVRSGVDLSLARIALSPERVHVRVTSEPSGGEAVITRGAERRVLGRTPIDVTLENDGTAWNVEVTRSGYEPFAQPLSIQDGAAELSVRAVLTRNVSEEASPAQATSEPPRSPRSAASASSDSEPSSAPSVGSRTEEPRASSSSSTKEGSAEGAGGQGMLRINSRPWSQVTIDGRAIGNTPQMNVPLPAGNHRVSLVNPEFNLKKTLTITIKPGQTETQIIALQ